MNKFELLAKLKQAYEILQDIIDNGNTSIPNISLSYISTEYGKVYDEITETNEDALFINVQQSTYKIGYSVNVDYQDINIGKTYTSGDINYQWWNDISLIQQLINNENELNNDEIEME